MGMNYYWTEKPPCECCNREYESVHIGKSAGGWCFSLRVYPSNGINTLDDWKARFSLPSSTIKDEYGRARTPAETLAEITDRAWEGKTPTAEELRRNYAEPGPNGLVRSIVGGGSNCIGHGEGTWDYFVVEFS